MNSRLIYIGLPLLLIGLLILGAMQPRPQTPSLTYPPGREPMALPQDYRDSFVHYATVARSDAMVRKLFISPEALEAVRLGNPLPERTMIIIEAYEALRTANGTLVRDAEGRLSPGTFNPDVHMAERRSTWRIEDLAASTHNGGWNYGAFDFNTRAANDRDLNDCFSCHDGTNELDFVFSRSQLGRYIATGEAQYVYCPLPGRVPCA